MMKIASGFDHAGVPLQQVVSEAIQAAGHELVDLGTVDDYPQIAIRVAEAVLDGRVERAVLVCGSGAGVAVAANKFPGIRAATITDSYTARQSVEHDDVNILCLGARVIGPELARELVTEFVGAEFSGAERHRRRIGQIEEIERRHAAG